MTHRVEDNGAMRTGTVAGTRIRSVMRKILIPWYRSVAQFASRHKMTRFPFAQATNALVVASLKEDVATVHGHTMFLDDKDSLSLSVRGLFEPAETALTMRELRRGDVFVDIGAHIGYYTLIAARCVGPAGTVFAFEPDPDNCALLSKNVLVNGYRNVVIVQKAVTETSGMHRLYRSSKNRGDHRLYDPHDGRPSVLVEGVRLDDYFREYNGPLDLIKMDIQGAEWGALQGMVGILRKYPAVRLITEFWPKGLTVSHADPEQYLALLLQHGFALFRINDATGGTERAHISSLLKTCTLENAEYANLFCVRSGPVLIPGRTPRHNGSAP